jgi:aspartyl-tRNA synthetase
MFTLKRTYKNNELRIDHVDEKVNLNGWVENIRPFGGMIFIDLRDRYGITQVVFDSEVDIQLTEKAKILHKEYCIAIRGTTRKRQKGHENKDLETGDIEVLARDLEILSESEPLPLDKKNALEEARLKYRYLDLRTKEMQNNLILRHTITQVARKHFIDNGFLEVETPYLVKATPEGARDYLVPSRVNPHHFYALPQSPQLYKQILMVAGIDRYFQFARCLRDEDLRSDRQPEHTQMDFEMSFVDEKDIMDYVESLFKTIIKEVKGINVSDFSVLTYSEAMNRFGSDKPDTRFALELTDVSEIMAQSEFNAFKEVVEKGGVVKCICVPKNYSRKEYDKMIELAKNHGAKGLAFMSCLGSAFDKGISKFFGFEFQKEILDATEAKQGDTLFFVADSLRRTNEILGGLRLHIGKELELFDENEFKFVWIKDFPLFAWDEDNEKWEPEHHMFSMPTPETVEYLDSNPEKVVGNLFDLAMNGWELGSGSIRINRPEIQKKVMDIVGFSEEEAQQKFGFLLDAYKYGGPPHGGMGLGLDRFVALIAGHTDLREVIAFPKNKKAQCPMDGSPSLIDEEQLKELHIDLRKVD